MTSSFLTRAAARTHWLITLLLMGTTATVHAQDREPRSWGVGVEGGVMALDGWETVEPVVVVQPWFRLGSAPGPHARTRAVSASRSVSPPHAEDLCRDRPYLWHCRPLLLEFPITIIPDPPCLCPPGADFARLRDLEGGPTVWLIPSLRFPVGRLGPLGSALSAGAGGFYQGGRTTVVEGAGTYTTEAVVAPAASVGLALDVALGRRVDLTMGVRGYAVFAGDMKVTTPTGSTVAKGERMLSQAFTAGVSLSP